jgi:hypothetical protein
MNESIGRGNAAFANVVGQDELCFALDCHKAPAVTDSFHVFFVLPLVTFFFEDVAPYFICLHVVHVKVLNPLAHQLLTAFASQYEQFQDCIAVDVCYSFDAANAHSFEQQLQSGGCAIRREAHFVERFFVIFCEGFATVAATESL